MTSNFSTKKIFITLLLQLSKRKEISFANINIYLMVIYKYKIINKHFQNNLFIYLYKHQKGKFYINYYCFHLFPCYYYL